MQEQKINSDGGANAIISTATLALALTPILKKLFEPTAEWAGGEIRDYLKGKVEIWKSKKQEENLRIHVQAVAKRMEAGHATAVSQPSISERQLNLFIDWAEHVKDIDPTQLELSQIWQELLVRIAAGENVTEEIFRCLKSLSSGEAKYLLTISEDKSLWGPKTRCWFRKRQRNERFYFRSLQQKQLANIQYLPFAIGLLIIAGLFAWPAWYLHTTQSWHWAPVSAKTTRAYLTFVKLLPFAIPFVVLSTMLVRPRLSWLGKDLVRTKSESRSSNIQPDT